MELVQIINSVGFPIVAFLLMFVFATKTIKENTKAITALRSSIDQLKERLK